MNLVREYVACMDEVSQIHSIAERKIDFLERLRQDCEVVEEDAEQPEEPVDDYNVIASPGLSADPHIRKLMIQRIDKAIQYIKANHERLPGTLNDLRNSLDDVSQPRTSTCACEMTFPSCSNYANRTE